MKLTTLCYIEKDDAMLMLHRIKKDHDVNKGKWIGVGGKFEAGESPDDCLLREVREERASRSRTGATAASSLSATTTTTQNTCIFSPPMVFPARSPQIAARACCAGCRKSEIPSLNLWQG